MMKIAQSLSFISEHLRNPSVRHLWRRGPLLKSRQRLQSNLDYAVSRLRSQGHSEDKAAVVLRAQNLENESAWRKLCGRQSRALHQVESRQCLGFPEWELWDYLSTPVQR